MTSVNVLYLLPLPYIMKKLLPLLFLCFTAAFSQEALLPVRILATPKEKPERFVGTDVFGWEYVIADNEFRKQKDGRVVKYKNLALGDIYKADLQNPLQIVLFYRKFNTVVLLDNQLNATSIIVFNELPKPILAEAVGLASQNRLWIYDVNTQQLGLYDPQRNAFRALTPPFNDTITWYQSDYNYFYWTDTTGKCFALNLFGTVTQLGSVPKFDAAQLLSPAVLLLQKDNTLCQYALDTQKQTPVAIVEKTFGAFYYTDGILSIFTDSEFIQYKISLPR